MIAGESNPLNSWSVNAIFFTGKLQMYKHWHQNYLNGSYANSCRNIIWLNIAI